MGIVSQGDEPQSLSDALKGAEEKEWRLSIDSELGSLERNKIWNPCVKPEDRNAIPVQLIFKKSECCRLSVQLQGETVV